MRLIWYADFTEKIPLEFGTQMSLCFLGLIGIGRERMAWAECGSNNSCIKLSFQGSVQMNLSVSACNLGIGVKFYSHGTQGLVHMLIDAPSPIR